MFDDNMERMGREISEEVNDMILNRLVDEARTYHNNTLQGVRDIGISVDENVGEIRYDERPMRA